MREAIDRQEIKEQLLTFYKDIAPEAYHVEDAAYMLGMKSADEVAAFMDAVDEAKRDGLLMTKDGEYYRYAPAVAKGMMAEGIYKSYRKSFGFVVGPNLEEDIHISEEHRHGAMQNDKVRVRIIGAEKGRRREGEIVAIIERANTIIVGTYDRQKKFGFVKPDDERITEDIYISLDHALDARSGAKVAVEIIKWPEGNELPEGRITAVLGYEGDKGLDINCIMAQHKIPFAFPEDVLKETESISMTVLPEKGRLDLRNEPMVTIDGEDAKDLDDAVSVKRLPNGHWQLGVHIADVSNYVVANTAIDREAYSRSTSVYLVDRVVPMLPTILSNGICSLNAGEDRYAMSCIMEIDDDGTVVESTISPSVIRVDRRCSYREIYQALEEDIIPDTLVPLMPMVKDLRNVAETLMAMRHRRGAINFEFPEFKIILDGDGTPLRIVKRERTIAEKIIEECMLIANETVACYLRDHAPASVYRIHETPNAEKLAALQNVLQYLGRNERFTEDVTPKDVQKFLESVSGEDIEQVAQVMTLRSMQQARYSANNAGHFGLASEYYTHFTSPIRRYPDLMVHRLLKKTMHWHDGYSKRDDDIAYLAEAAEHCSMQEQVAVEAERDTDDLKKVQYMERYVGEVFTGRINSITGFGMFVELENGIDGLVHVSMMEDDHYFFDEDHFLLVGRRTGKQYHLGQEVTVTLIKADTERRQIDFVLGEVENLAALQRRWLDKSMKRDSQAGRKKGDAGSSAGGRSKAKKSRNGKSGSGKGKKKKAHASRKRNRSKGKHRK